MILVTGGTGQIGSMLIYDLVRSGKQVRALIRQGSSRHNVERLFKDKSELKNIEWVEGDVLDLFSLDDAMKGVDVIYHSAAFISFHPGDGKKMMKVNSGGTANMVNMAMKNNVKRFCHMSSTSALADSSGDEMVDENSWWKTSKYNSWYSLSKYGAEREVWRGMEEGLSAFILNPTIVVGPGDWKTGSTQMFGQVWKGLPFYASGVTGFVDVRDVTKAAIQLMDKGVSNERYIINADNLPYRFVFDKIAENFGRKKAYIHVTPFLSELGWRLERIRGFIFGKNSMITKDTARNGMKKSYYSNEKIKKELGIDFINIENAIKDTCDIFLNEIKGIK